MRNSPAKRDLSTEGTKRFENEASITAMPEEGVAKLVEFMRDFEARNLNL